jgi:hypothetical protein
MKKLICFSLFAFMLSSGFTVQSQAQNWTDSYTYTGGYFADVFCNEVAVDQILGNVAWHVRDHYKNGELEWSIYTASGSLTSANGEVFEIHESDKIYWSQNEWTFHCNLIGNLGNHYILSGHGDTTTWEVFIDKANCLSQ